MNENELICPILSAGWISAGHSKLTVCVGDSCALWDEECECCGLVCVIKREG